MTKPFKVWDQAPYSTSRNMTQLTSRSRDTKTLPPPPPGATAVELDQRAAELRRMAQALLANANDVERIAASMRGAL